MSDPKNLKPLPEFVLNVKIARIDDPELQKTIDANPDKNDYEIAKIIVADDAKRQSSDKILSQNWGNDAWARAAAGVDRFSL